VLLYTYISYISYISEFNKFIMRLIWGGEIEPSVIYIYKEGIDIILIKIFKLITFEWTVKKNSLAFPFIHPMALQPKSGLGLLL
jgi:hypothetical protein